MTNPLEYEKTPTPEGAVMNFSPSKFSQFVEKVHIWYQEQVLGESGFEYNTSSVLGTCVHYCAEMVAKEEPVDKKVIEEYIGSKPAKEDYDPEIVRQHYVAMAEELVNSYVLTNRFLEVEGQYQVEIKDGYYAGGKIDALQGTKLDCMVTDYKSYNSKTKPKSIPSYYRYQLMVYSWILKKLGYNPTRIRLVFVNRPIDGGLSPKTGKPLKSYPSEVTVLTEVLDESDFEFIESLLHLAVDSVKAYKAYPELAHVIWHDPRLKEEEKEEAL